MKVSREQATENRERIVQVAAKLFRSAASIARAVDDPELSRDVLDAVALSLSDRSKERRH